MSKIEEVLGLLRSDIFCGKDDIVLNHVKNGLSKMNEVELSSLSILIGTILLERERGIYETIMFDNPLRGK
jgi:hypothetical protein